MKLYVVRHAQADHNILDISNDATSSVAHLTQVGIEQAQALAGSIKNTTFDVIYTSEMERTIETADILRPHQNKIKDLRINDIRTGMEGRPFNDFRQALARSDDHWNVRFGDGESFSDEKARTVNFLNDLKKNDYKNVLVVTHGGVANIIYGLSHGLSNEDTFNREIHNASIFEVNI